MNASAIESHSTAAVEQTLSLIRGWWPESDMGCHPYEIPNAGRAELSRLFHVLGFKCGVEIGVQRGDFSARLCADNPNLILTGVDPYTVRTDYAPGGMTQGDMDAMHAATVERLTPLGVRLLRARSADVVSTFADGALDFVYIDGHHNLPNVIYDLCAWTAKVRVGGIIAGDDYYTTKEPKHGLHVKQAVDAFTNAYGIQPWFVLGRRSAALGEVRDRHRSFFWVRAPIALDTGR